MLYFIETEESLVALTIDDGPDPETTPSILQLLARHHARATFFLISDRVDGNAALVRRAVAEGHELGNHLTRDEPSIALSSDEFAEALREAHATLARFAPVRWVRPGSGWYDREMLSIIAAHGYRAALGSVYPYDALIPSSRFAAQHVLRKVRPGSIIILHDGGARGARTAQTLEAILPELARRGLQVVTLSELIPVGALGEDTKNGHGR